jgi:hypothetical protein
MARTSNASLLIGAAAGAAFFAHAMVQNSHAWPLIWALLGGFLAVFLARRDVPSFAAAAKTGALTGLVAGIVFFAATAVTMLVLKAPAGAAGEVQDRPGALLVGLAITAALAVIVAAVGGAVAWSVAKPKTQS